MRSWSRITFSPFARGGLLLLVSAILFAVSWPYRQFPETSWVGALARTAGSASVVGMFIGLMFLALLTIDRLRGR